jgi:ABC-2 type transport system ATP-binding protein
MKDEIILKVEDLKKNYGKFKAVKGVSFEVKKGEIFGLLGPNGAGKTTTLEMIEGLRKIDGGRAEIAGLSVSEHTDEIKSIIGVQLQSSSFFDYLNLGELLKFFGILYGRKIDPVKILKEVELVDKKSSYIKTLSGGQKQRFSIASALVNRPQILFLDEPTTGLDPQARRHLWDLIRKIREKGMTVVITTHYMDEAEFLCDRVGVMDAGKIVSLDTPDNLINKLVKSGFKKKVINKGANLEDVFLNLTGRHLRD